MQLRDNRRRMGETSSMPAAMYHRRADSPSTRKVSQSAAQFRAIDANQCRRQMRRVDQRAGTLNRVRVFNCWRTGIA